MSEQNLITWEQTRLDYWYGSCKFDCSLGIIRDSDNKYICYFRLTNIGEFDTLEQAKQHCETFLVISAEERALIVENLINK